jgi:glycosyltransferase involved in cell wall biosynthesis
MSPFLRRGRRATPRVSVVINTLNRRERLERLLLALRSQKHAAFEVVVVNGPSVDGTDALLTDFKDRAHLATCPDACLGRSRNIGVAAASGEIVAFIDDDAIPARDWLTRLSARYADPSVVGVGGAVFDVWLDRVVWTLCTATRAGDVDTEAPGPVDRYLVPGGDPIAYLPGCNMSFRRVALEEAGGFNPLLSYAYDDSELAVRLVDRGHRLIVLDTALVRHERAPNIARDEERRLFDRAPVNFCRAVFAVHSRRPGTTAEDAAARVRAAFAGEADARVREAIEAGLRAASRPRPVTSMPFDATAGFLPYR